MISQLPTLFTLRMLVTNGLTSLFSSRGCASTSCCIASRFRVGLRDLYPLSSRWSVVSLSLSLSLSHTSHRYPS
ncbi:hypothetical protein BKA62DRAFT_449513 [Auriculariales sp. MPI-PUGE-AT-0066]|nr:hypothetical protein BKA62DRAFT_449513 [Auriculariales sp. MPI-PUGE-AT-0066]